MQRRDAHLRASVWRVQHASAPDVDADVMDRRSRTRPEEDQVAGTQVPSLDAPAETGLVRGVAWQRPPQCAEDAVGQPGAVDARLGHPTPEVRRPEIAAGDAQLAHRGWTAYDRVVGVAHDRLGAELPGRHPARDALAEVGPPLLEQAHLRPAPAATDDGHRLAAQRLRQHPAVELLADLQRDPRDP